MPLVSSQSNTTRCKRIRFIFVTNYGTGYEHGLWCHNMLTAPIHEEHQPRYWDLSTERQWLPLPPVASRGQRAQFKNQEEGEGRGCSWSLLGCIHWYILEIPPWLFHAFSVKHIPLPFPLVSAVMTLASPRCFTRTYKVNTSERGFRCSLVRSRAVS